LVLKALAIVGVVLHHTRNRRLDPSASEGVGTLIEVFSWCVLLFLAVSGWLHAMSEARRPQTLAAFASSKATRLLAPFVALVVAYAMAWELIQRSNLLPLNGNVPLDLLDKLRVSLWPAGPGAVGEQLYFLPLLLLISLGVQLVLRIGGMTAVKLACALALVLALSVYPQSPITGFSLGVAAWGAFAYTSGFLLYGSRDMPTLPFVGLACAIVAVVLLGPRGIPKVMPVLLLSLARPLRLAEVPFAPRLGAASGTVFAYHTPFLLQPLVMLASKLPDWRLQLFGVLLAAATVIAVTWALHQWLENTRFRFVLL
jgi:acyltransferase